MTAPALETVDTTVIHDDPCHLGEGPTYDPASDTAWWFDIIGQTLFEHRLQTGETIRHALPVMGSQLSFSDDGRQLLAADEGLLVRDLSDGRLTLVAEIESDNAATRSNDGRVHPSGALWIGTMGREGEHGAGSIYWFRSGEVRRLFHGITIPNAICFSEDGRYGYFTDTPVGRLMRVELEPGTGLPIGEPTLLHDWNGEHGRLDGAVVDADGLIWVARWGGAAVTAITPDGDLVRRIALPTAQTTCPAFVGERLDRMLVTSAYQGMDAAKRAADPKAGMIFLLDFPMRGRADNRVLL